MRQEDEQLLSSYFDSAPGFFYTLVQGRNGGYAMPFASAGMRDLFGVEPGDVAEDIAPFIAVVHPDDSGTIFHEIEASARSLACCQFEFRIIHPQKGVRWIAAHSQPQCTPDRGMRWAGFMQDISGRKEGEQRLNLQEFILDHAHEAVYLMDRADFSFVYVNEAACLALGYTRDELMGLSLREIDPDLTPEAGRELWAKIFVNGVHTFEARHRRRDGSIFSVEIQGSMFEFEGRKLSLSLVRDITERKRMEEALSAREQAFRSLAESSPDVVIRVDRDLRIRYLNANMLNYLKLGSAEEVIGRQSIEIWPDGRFNEIDALREHVVMTGEMESVELSVPVLGGKMAYHQVISVPERDTDGHIIGTLTFGRDITAIRETERRLSGLVENLPGIVYTLRLSPEGEMSFPYVSAGVEEIYGITPEVAMGDFSMIHGLIHPDDKPGMEALFAESMRTLTPYRVEMRICPHGLPERWLDVRSDPQAQPDGSILWYGLIFDITERKRAAALLEESGQQMVRYFASTPGYFQMTELGADGSFRVPFASDGIVELFGLKPEDVKENVAALAALNHPDDAEMVFSKAAESARDLTPYCGGLM